MNQSLTLESFIPFRRGDLVQLCLEEGVLKGEQVERFREFCAILQAYLHFKQHTTLEHLKDQYARFNPDAVTIALDSQFIEQDKAASDVAGLFEKTLQQANFKPLKDERLQDTLKEASLIPLTTHLDFADYYNILIYYRGERIESRAKYRFFSEKTMDIRFFDRVAVLLHFKDAEHFKAKGEDLSQLTFQPGAMYLYLYKDIPSFDLDLIFPTLKVSMNWWDRLLFGVPALGAAVPIIVKALPSLGLLISAIVVLVLGTQAASDLGIDLNQVDSLWPVLTAVLSLGMGVGGFAVKQYVNYKNKRLKFLKKVTDTLFFSQLVANAGVLYSLVDLAEEEIAKEMILVFYQLLKAENGLTAQQLDQQIEAWLTEKINSLRPLEHTNINRLSTVDFNIDKALEHLSQLKAPLNADEYGLTALVQRDHKGVYRAVSLTQARYMIDYLWDRFFSYANKT